MSYLWIKPNHNMTSTAPIHGVLNLSACTLIKYTEIVLSEVHTERQYRVGVFSHDFAPHRQRASNTRQSCFKRLQNKPSFSQCKTLSTFFKPNLQMHWGVETGNENIDEPISMSRAGYFLTKLSDESRERQAVFFPRLIFLS